MNVVLAALVTYQCSLIPPRSVSEVRGGMLTVLYEFSLKFSLFLPLSIYYLSTYSLSLCVSITHKTKRALVGRRLYQTKRR